MVNSQFIEGLRKRKKLSQEFIASAIGISRPTYVQIERGERDLTVTEAKKLAVIFEISLDNLLSGKIIFEPNIIFEKEEERKLPQIEIRVTRKNMEKFKQVLLYVLEKVGAKPNIGETVLYKLLYFIDFDYYEKFEESLMGATYIKNHHGPTPVEFKDIVAKMKKDGDIEEVKSSYFTYAQKKYLPHKRPDLSLLSGREIEHIDEVLARLSDKRGG